MRVLDPASEAVLLIVRAALEVRLTDPVMVRHRAAVVQKFAFDRAHLAARLNPDAVRGAPASCSASLFADDFAQAIFGETPLEKQQRLFRRVRSALKAYRTCNAAEATLRHTWRAARWIAGAANQRLLHWPRPWARRAPGGGIVVAVLGVDGSGKSTLVRSLNQWLGQEVDVLPIYFGTGDGRPSLLLLPLKLLVPLASPLFRKRPKGSSHGEVGKKAPGSATASC